MLSKLILWGSMIWLAPLMYFMLRNEAKFKKNIAVGVTFPYDGRVSPAVLGRLAQYKRELGWTCLLLAALGIAMTILPVSFGVSLTMFLIWADLCVLLPYAPYIRCNRDLKKLKAERGWSNPAGQTVTVDLSAAAQPRKELSVWYFVPPLLIAMAPCVWEIAAGERLWGFVMLIAPGCVVLFYFLYRCMFRRKSDQVDGNTDLTQTLTRLRRQYWRRAWLWSSWAMGLLALCMWLFLYNAVPGIICMALLTFGILLVAIYLEFKLRRVQERLTENCGHAAYVDEDDKWLWGLFYYDSNDRRLVVNSRVGGNTTINLSRPGGKVLIGSIAALLMLLPLLGVWVIEEERAPVEISVAEDTLSARHWTSHYEIPLEEISEIELLEEMPAIYRVAGTGLDTVRKGYFRSDEWGRLTVCLDPRTGPWLLVRTREGGVYLVGDSRQGEITRVLDVLLD